eukprot:UN31955
MVGIWQIILGVFGLGYICSFLSSPVMNGSLCGAAFIIMSTQLKHLVGVDYPRSSYFFETVYLFYPCAAYKMVGIKCIYCIIICITFLRNAKRSLKNGQPFFYITPGSTISKIILISADFSSVLISVLGIIVGYIVVEFDREELIPLVGSLPDGVLEFTNSFSMDTTIIPDLIIPSFVISLISFVLAIALAKKLGNMFNYPVDASQELTALGIACFLGSFLKCMPMQSSLSRTMVNVQSGAQTGMASWIASTMVLLGLLLLKPALYYLPKASLGAIIEVAAFKLVDFEMPRWLYQMHTDWASKLRSDWAVWLAAFCTTLSVGVVYGVTVGLGLSCLLLIERSTKPKYAILGRLPGTSIYRSVSNFPEALIRSSVLVVRFDASLHFANAGYFKDLLHHIETSVEKIGAGTRLAGIVVDMGCVNEVDATGIQVLKEMLIEYAEKNITLVFANMKGTV